MEFDAEHSQVSELRDVPPFDPKSVGEDSLAAALDVIREYGRRHGDVYGGAFPADGQVFVGFTSYPMEHVRELQIHVGRIASLKAFRATFTLDTLQSVKARLSAEIRSLRGQGIRISSVAVDEYHNRVAVRLAGSTESAISALRRTFGDVLIFSEGDVIAVQDATSG